MDKTEKWYVIQTRAGSEDEVRDACDERMIKRGVKKIFVPKAEMKRKYHGEWLVVNKPMYPGYIFMSVNDGIKDKRDGKPEIHTDKQGFFATGSEITDALFMDLKNVPRLTRLVGAGRTAIPLDDEEVIRIRRLTGDGDIAELSKGIIEGDRLEIFEGPLKGQEAIVKKIDRHRRTAKIEMMFLGEVREIEVGLEVVMKK